MRYCLPFSEYLFKKWNPNVFNNIAYGKWQIFERTST